jgi:diamine N-acetyltransferase
MINIRGTYIMLRAPEQSDLETLYKWENDTGVWQVSNTLAPFSRFVLEQYLVSAHLDIYTNKQLRLMICREGEEPVGCIDLYEFDPHHSRAGIGIVITNEHRTKGYADDALKTLIDYAFGTLCLNQLFCSIGAGNVTSLKLFEKNGFKKIGLKKEWLKTAANVYEDEWSLQLLNPDRKGKGG